MLFQDQPIFNEFPLARRNLRPDCLPLIQNSRALHAPYCTVLCVHHRAQYHTRTSTAVQYAVLAITVHHANAIGNTISTPEGGTPATGCGDDDVVLAQTVGPAGRRVYSEYKSEDSGVHSAQRTR